MSAPALQHTAVSQSLVKISLVLFQGLSSLLPELHEGQAMGKAPGFGEGVKGLRRPASSLTPGYQGSKDMKDQQALKVF